MGRRSGGSARSGCRATTRGRGGTGGPWPAGPGPRRPDRRPGRSTSTWPSPTRWSRSARPRPPRGRGWAGSRRRGGPEGRRGRPPRPGGGRRAPGAGPPWPRGGGAQPGAGRAGGAPWTAAPAGVRSADPGDVAALAEAVRAQPRGVLVAGWGADLDPAAVDAFAAASGWPVLADPLSGARRGPAAISAYDRLLPAPGFAAP